MNDSGVTYEMVLEEIKSNRGDESSLFQDLQEQEIEDGFTDDDEDEDDEDDFQKGRSAQHSSGTANPSQGKSSSDTPVLDNFGTDMTRAASENRLDPVVGREKR